jgi:hypothetical protein
MKGAFKNYNVGSIRTRFYYDILEGNACLSGSASRKTKRSFKRLASKANRRMVKQNTRENLRDAI